MIHVMNLNQHCLYHGLLYSTGTHLNPFTIFAKVGRRDVHFGITDNEKKPHTKKSSRKANHYHMFCRGSFGPCTVLMTHMEKLLAPIILDTPTDWDTVITWPILRPGTIVRSVPLLEALNATSDQGQASAANAASSSTFVPPLVASVASLPPMSQSVLLSVALDATSVHGLASDVFAASSSTFVAPPFASVPSLRSVLASEALNATLVHAQTSNVIAAISSTCVAVHAHASDANASVSSTFVAPPVSVDESLVRVPMSAAGEDLKLGRSVFVGLVLTWQFTALPFYMVSRSYGAHLSHLGLYKDPFQIASGAHFVLIFGLSYMR
jgi:hypothetical protein